MSPKDWKLLLLGLAVVLALYLLLLGVDYLYAKSGPHGMTFTVDEPHGMKIEVRRCHPIGNSDESDDQVTCSCTVADWIEDGDARILVCER